MVNKSYIYNWPSKALLAGKTKISSENAPVFQEEHMVVDLNPFIWNHLESAFSREYNCFREPHV